MNKIKVGKHTIALNFDYQVGPTGEMFRLSASVRGIESIWINRVKKFDMIHVFKYKTTGSFFGIHLEPNGTFKKKLNHDEVLKLMRDE